MTESSTPYLQQWAILELFGHQKVAGRVSEYTLGGVSFVRVDVPEIEAQDHSSPMERKRTVHAHTRCFGPAAIYAINWCDEQTALIAATSIIDEPLSIYSTRRAINAMSAEQRHILLTSSIQRDLEPNPDDDAPF
jgi:hypothetical protein